MCVDSSRNPPAWLQRSFILWLVTTQALHSPVGSPEPLKASPRTKCKCFSVNQQQLQGTFGGKTLTENTKFPQWLLNQGRFLQIPVSCIYGHLLLRLSEIYKYFHSFSHQGKGKKAGKQFIW